MDIDNLSQILRQGGIVGVGGAGFPTYAKLSKNVDTVILNCAECEPLLALHRQLLEHHCDRVLEALHMIVETLDANEAIIALKNEYRHTAEVVRRYMGSYPRMRMHLLENVYPSGDEVVLIYEVTKKAIPAGRIPINENIAVFNVETVYNVYRAYVDGRPVTEKYITVAGSVRHPMTVKVPIGITLEEVVEYANNNASNINGTARVNDNIGSIRDVNNNDDDDIYLVGGPMMGVIKAKQFPVTKTTNAIIVLPKDHMLITRKQVNISTELKRAASACCLCQTCTDLCPRNALGHPIEPHMFMRSAAKNTFPLLKPLTQSSNHVLNAEGYKDFSDTQVFKNTFFCSSCGVCELYACPQSLSPRTLISECKESLKREGVRMPQDAKTRQVRDGREYRRVPEARLKARLGLAEYDREVIFDENMFNGNIFNENILNKNAKFTIHEVRILLSQHIGIPSKVVVAAGDMVTKGQKIGEPADGLSVAIHSSIDGKVTKVTEEYIIISRIHNHIENR